MSMRKIVIVAAAIGLFSLTASAEVYLEAGFGVGKGITLFDGEELFPGAPNEMAVELGLKVGYGPLAGLPLYVTGEIGGMGHRFYDDTYFIQYNAYLVGPGIIYYPIPRLQTGVSIGYSYTANAANLPISVDIPTGSGFAYNASVGYELGNQSNGFLIGLKYFNALNFIKIGSESVTESSMFIGLFMRYTRWWGRF